MIHRNSQLPKNEIDKIFRLKEIRNILHIGQQEMADKLGIKRPNLSAIENLKENRVVPNGTAYVLETEYNVNRTWFETGEGEKFKEQNVANNILAEPAAEYKVNIIKNNTVPIYDIEFAAGVMKSLIENREDHYPVGYLGIPEVIGCDAIIRAKGDSMADRINDRDWIGIKKLNKDEWFPLGYIYAIETEQAQIIKYIKKGNSDSMIKIVSHNTFYDDEEIPKSLIKEIWSVRAVLPFSKIETLM